MTAKQTPKQLSKSILFNNTAPGVAETEMDRLAQRWIEIVLDQIQKLPGAISTKTLDN